MHFKKALRMHLDGTRSQFCLLAAVDQGWIHGYMDRSAGYPGAQSADGAIRAADGSLWPLRDRHCWTPEPLKVPKAAKRIPSKVVRWRSGRLARRVCQK